MKILYFAIFTLSGQTLIKNEKGKKTPLAICYPPPHLYHILYELFKNSMRATVEKHRTASDLPGIEVLVAKGEHDVSIRISDQVQSETAEILVQFTIAADIAGRRYPSSHHRSPLSLFVLHGPPTLHDSDEGSPRGIRLRSAPVSAVRQILSW